MDAIEAAILTGGASRRMGWDKAGFAVGGVPMAERIAMEFDRIGVPVTVLGREPIEGRAFLKDQEEFAGPASALCRFLPVAQSVFVCSCDLPLFRAECVTPLVSALHGHEAAIPMLDGMGQPLCAAYSAAVFAEWRHLVESGGARSMRELVRVLDCEYLDEQRLSGAGLDPAWYRGANTQEEFDGLLDG